MSHAGPRTSQRAGEPLVRLASGAPAPRSLVGGKAAGLDWLGRNGFPTPEALCVTTAAYDAFLREQGLRERLEALAPGAGDEDARRRIAALYRQGRLPAGLAEAIGAALEHLPETFPGVRLLAVRSSGVDEDSTTASFAGQHDTFLGVEPGAVEAAVLDCWASLWSRQAVAYRSDRGLGAAGARMAVVLQPLMAAQVSAVAFSVNPVTGDRDEVVVCAVRGLGEPLVGGKVVGDTFVLDKDTAKEKETTAGRQTLTLLAEPGGVRYVEHPAREEPCLDAGRLAELAELVVEVEEAAGEPVDVEVALAAGRWLLLQARSVTSMTGPDLAGRRT